MSATQSQGVEVQEMSTPEPRVHYTCMCIDLVARQWSYHTGTVTVDVEQSVHYSCGVDPAVRIGGGGIVPGAQFLDKRVSDPILLELCSTCGCGLPQSLMGPSQALSVGLSRF